MHGRALDAITHGGLLETGQHYFESMRHVYNMPMKPDSEEQERIWVEIYAVVDQLVKEFVWNSFQDQLHALYRMKMNVVGILLYNVQLCFWFSRERERERETKACPAGFLQSNVINHGTAFFAYDDLQSIVGILIVIRQIYFKYELVRCD
ncbi:hypothetical protein ACJX0J_032044 [Zea mays]